MVQASDRRQGRIQARKPLHGLGSWLLGLQGLTPDVCTAVEASDRSAGSAMRALAMKAEGVLCRAGPGDP